MKRLIACFVCGLIFGLGLAVSGMTDPNRVLGFLTLGPGWDPTLMFVLGGAVGVTALTFHVIVRRAAPVCDPMFHLPPAGGIDAPLLTGSALFGLGWGLSGYCPGPAISLLANPGYETLTFLPAMLVGLMLGNVALKARGKSGG